MNKKLAKLEFFGFIFVSVLGVIMHFAYEWSNESKVIALISPINESPWEHLKLLFFPYVIYGVYEAIRLTDEKFNVYFAKLIGILLAFFTTLSVYYISLGATGRQIEWVSIASFFIGAAVGYLISYNIINKSIGRGLINGLSIAGLLIIALLFFFLTHFPIKIPLFMDPQTLTYGIDKLM